MKAEDRENRESKGRGDGWMGVDELEADCSQPLARCKVSSACVMQIFARCEQVCVNQTSKNKTGSLMGEG
eukprot:750001-Hanusia_phi.AAC.1